MARQNENGVTTQKNKDPKRQAYFSILLSAVAIVALTTATVAWFTIADFTKVNSMSMQITSGTNLRFDLDPHGTFEEYIKTLYFRQIADRIKKELGYDCRKVPLEPVTTKDAKTFTLENGTIVKEESGSYLVFTLHFMATEDMLVHLTSQGSNGNSDGTKITSGKPQLAEAMRISFTADDVTYIYDPGMGNDSKKENGIKTFGLPGADKMVLSDRNAMFWLKKDQDKPVIVKIWMEGTDPACDDELRGADYSISLRFVGTDKNHQILDGIEH